MKTKTCYETHENCNGSSCNHEKAKLPSFTPGPWTASFNGNDDTRIFAESVADSPRCIAKVNTPLYRGLESAANARLIAAAPELLEALNYLQSMPNDPRAHRAALDAIRKATT